MNSVWSISSRGLSRAVPTDAFETLIESTAATAGHYSAILLWPIFWLLACAVFVVFVVTVFPPLRRQLTQLLQRHPRIRAVMLPAFFSLFSTYLLGVWALFHSEAHVSTLLGGQPQAFLRAIFVPRGQLNSGVVVCGILWLAIQAASFWIAWRLIFPCPQPQGGSAARTPWVWGLFSKSSRNRLFIIFSAVALAVVLSLAIRLHSSQANVDLAVAADRVARHRLTDAQAKVNGFAAQHTRRREMLAAWARGERLSNAWTDSARRLGVARRERNRRLHQFKVVSILLAVLWLVFSAGRIETIFKSVHRPRDER